MATTTGELPKPVSKWLAGALVDEAGTSFKLLETFLGSYHYLLAKVVGLGEGRNSVDKLPAEIRQWLDRSLLTSNFSGYALLEEALRARGYVISKSAIHRYGQKIERRMAAIKASTEAAKMLTEGAADASDSRSEALLALVQTELFETLINLQEAGEAEDAGKRVSLLSNAAKNIATLTRASVTQKRWSEEVRQQALQEAAASVEDAARAQGMTEDQVQFWRGKVLGV